MNFIAATEGQLPASYYAFNRASIDFPAALAGGREASQAHARHAPARAHGEALDPEPRSCGLRASGSETSPGWSSEHWEAANPKAEGDDYSGRIAQLATLEDNAVVLMPLQYAPLHRNEPRRRALLSRPALGDGRGPAALGYALRPQRPEADDGAGKVHAGEIDRAGLERRRDWKARRRRRDAQKSRRFDPVDQAATTEHVGFENAVELPKLANARRRDDGVPARSACEARSVARAAAARRRAHGREEPPTRRRRPPHRPPSRRAPRWMRRSLPHSAISPPPSRRVRRCSSYGRRAKRWARTFTR